MRVTTVAAGMCSSKDGQGVLNDGTGSMTLSRQRKHRTGRTDRLSSTKILQRRTSLFKGNSTCLHYLLAGQ